MKQQPWLEQERNRKARECLKPQPLAFRLNLLVKCLKGWLDWEFNFTRIIEKPWYIMDATEGKARRRKFFKIGFAINITGPDL